VPARLRRDAIVCVLVPTPPHGSLEGMRAERTSGPDEEAREGREDSRYLHDKVATIRRPRVVCKDFEFADAHVSTEA
jgi:hypothetical protein